MKAHINQQAARPLALLYGLPESTETGRGVRAALEEQGFSSKEIAPEQLLQPVGALRAWRESRSALQWGSAGCAAPSHEQFYQPSAQCGAGRTAGSGRARSAESRCDEAQQDMERAGTLEELQREREATRPF